MAHDTRPATQQSSPALPGTWKLAAGRAVTLEPSEAGTFRVAHGEVWATYDDGPHGQSPEDSGDHVIGAGQSVRLRAGERMVIEAWNWQSPSYFSWEPAPVVVRSRAPRASLVLQPLADLRLALAFGAGAIGRLAAGMAAIALESIRGQRTPSLRTGGRECTAHGT